MASESGVARLPFSLSWRMFEADIAGKVDWPVFPEG